MDANAPVVEPHTRPGEAGAARPQVTELRLTAFRKHRGAVLALGPMTLFAGASGSGKSSALQAYEALALLGCGHDLEAAFPEAADCVPEGARADRQGRRGFRIGCTVDGPAGPVRLDLAVQAVPRLEVVGERLTAGGRTLLTTALRDPARPEVEAAWHTAGAAGVTRGRLPADRLGTALLPLHVAGRTPAQLRVLAAAEQVVLALRSVFACDPWPQRMRKPVAAGPGRLRRGCDNLAEVLHRTRSECGKRHARLAAAARVGCAGEVTDLRVEELGNGTVRALLARGGTCADTPLGRLGEGELRYLALALVLLTGPGVLSVDQVAEVPAAYQSLTVLADGFDRCLDPAQARELVGLAAEMCARGHIRLAGAVFDASCARGVDGVSVVDLVP
ncbi:ATP-binding protein [Streptomyces sp. ISL-10]|uniref:AAA family ATPase n=1 Tax=Streptomyces sp. ISL-10 TaxID=2819172 RepID=UPI001BE7BE9B|nr:ATP-binding protein [Streptomyces sp. ISL-10]MBT2364026.1 ATP-binding protein [Streptomyces sp. ISL-10]